ncbi:unnamed protein product [Moneuplotes crassus]|uniref:Uncharacterized protein n=1 Tax=Euplotes crassus TaxID=5936 RepID=A0AAD1YDL9_EUPCR|nr:unnamed protein product [Moneuplotes crassus]
MLKIIFPFDCNSLDYLKLCEIRWSLCSCSKILKYCASVSYITHRNRLKCKLRIAQPQIL